jgi:hypothetical protein
LETFLGIKLEGFYRAVEFTSFESASELEASVWQVEQDENKHETKKKKSQVTNASPFNSF